MNVYIYNMYTTLLHVVVKINNELFLIHVQGILHVHMCVHTPAPPCTRTKNTVCGTCILPLPLLCMF